MALDTAADLAGVDLTSDVVALYLRKIGIKSHATISTYLHDNAAITDLITKPKAGVTVSDTEFSLNYQTILTKTPSRPSGWYSHNRHDMLTSWRRRRRQHLRPHRTPRQPRVPQPIKTRSRNPCRPGSTPSLSRTTTTLPSMVHGEKRQFNLLGAEKVLARMYHEHHTSKLYTATSLGEILSQRIWMSFNTINANRKKDASEKKLVIDDRNNIAEKAQEDWDVRGQWMLIDAIEAIRWAWVLIKHGTETVINKYVDWFTRNEFPMSRASGKTSLGT